jgi:hypothetical protein
LVSDLVAQATLPLLQRRNVASAHLTWPVMLQVLEDIGVDCLKMICVETNLAAGAYPRVRGYGWR